MKKLLKNIPKIIPPELLKILCEMGHGDELVIADGNFPSANIGQRTVYMRGSDGVAVLKAILELYPLDTYQNPVYLMQKVEGDNVETPIWSDYEIEIKKYTEKKIKFIDRFGFYERAKQAYAVIATGESSLYANIILKKGVIT